MPLLFDMPLEKLRTYKGINPKPANFDAYWKKALAEMRAVDPQIEEGDRELQAEGRRPDRGDGDAARGGSAFPRLFGRCR